MDLRVAGKDRAVDLGEELKKAAAQRSAGSLADRLARELDVLSLGAAGDADAYLGRHMELLRSRNCVDPSYFDPPPARGMGAGLRTRIRRFLWKLLRHQHDWLFFRQNAINVQLAYELEFEREARKRETSRLQERMKALEERSPADS